jgi:hypothetical protein
VHAEAALAQTDDGIADKLAGPVVGDVSAALDAYQLDPGR